MSGYYDLKRSGDQYMFNLKAGNYAIILSSERYKTRAAAVAGIESVRKNSPLDERFERRTASDGSPYFVLKAGNGEVLGRSEMYSTPAACEKGIQSVKHNGPLAQVKDNT
ncbi:YegP family protein [Alcaligenes sp. SDU_A2]|uniref:YegP family protein n=1 Tax=Alcaligenes sp. SDU_A2 TaxID=3136634 RepID=UPI002C48088E|nr:YegP family protein [Alcaligenes sp.]HRL26723.1 YegP family protein [Alcaligenes sp.]